MKKSEIIAFLLMLLGSAGKDSPNTILPAMLALIGALILFLRSLENETDGINQPMGRIPK